jgi:putative tricarboxylic transport membrane protein
MNIPGAPSSYATTFDGYAMSKKGLHNEALGYALFASTICGIFGYLLLLLVVEPLAAIVLRIGPVEMFAVAIWGMLLLGSLGSKYVTRGLLAAAFGILLGTVGMNTAGYIRGTLGLPVLLDGVSPIPAMIGLLAAGQLLTLASKDYVLDAESARTVSLRRILDGCRGCLRFPGVMLRGSVIGVDQTHGEGQCQLRPGQSERRGRFRIGGFERRGGLNGHDAGARHPRGRGDGRPPGRLHDAQHRGRAELHP